MNKYSEYKDNPVPWIERIPAHWGLMRGKNLFAKMQRPVREFDEVVTCFRDGTVTLRKNRRISGFTESLKEIGYQGIRKGDLVIHVMDAFAGSIGVSDSDGKGTPVYSVCQAKGDSNNQYYAMLLREMARTGYIQSLYRGIRERSSDFRFEVFASQFYPVPPRSEQDLIVKFLDWKVSCINKLISVRKKQISELSILEQRVIAHAITKGLDSHVSMKDSGVSWIGLIPKHWEISRIKRCSACIGSGTTPPSQLRSLFYNGEINWIQSGDIYGRRIIDSVDTTVTSKALKELSALKCYKAPFIAIAMYGGSVGNTAISTIDACTNQSVCVIVPKKTMDIKYLYYWFLFCKSELLSVATGGGQPNISQQKIKNEICLMVPLLEQRNIVAHLDKHISDIEDVIHKRELQIQKLNELKDRLIADSVTGKIDVRDIEIPEYEFVEEETDSDVTDSENEEGSEE